MKDRDIDEKCRGSIRVLIADDTPSMLDAVEEQLASDYIIVGKVTDGIALVAYARDLDPDILVTDISMPKLTGIEALRQLRNFNVKTPVVILTVCDDEEVVKEALSLGARGFVLKCRLTTDLQLAICEVLAGRTFVSEGIRKVTTGAN